MIDTVASQVIDLSSWGILYKVPNSSSTKEMNNKNGNCSICLNTGKPSKVYVSYS
jgi:hypothetical protein